MLFAASLASGSVEAGAYDRNGLAPGDHAQVAALCRDVIGVSPPSARFEACLDGLASTVAAVDRSAGLADARTDCLHAGASAGSALAQCELDRSRRPGRRATLTAASSPPLARAKPYWAASNAEIHAREETACARLGLEPAGGAFSSCVAELDASLFAADNPAH